MRSHSRPNGRRLEAVRIAKSYAEDPDGLLRHFPVPRMRMPTIEMTLPVIVGQIPEGYVASSLDLDARDFARREPRASPESPVHPRQHGRDQQDHQGRSEFEPGPGQRQPRSEAHRTTDRPHPGGAQSRPGRRRRARWQAAPSAQGRSARIIRAQVSRTLDALPQRAIGISVDARTQQIKDLGAAGQWTEPETERSGGRSGHGLRGSCRRHRTSSRR